MNKAARPSRETALFLCIAAAFIAVRLPAIARNYFGMECATIIELARGPVSVLIQNSKDNTYSPLYFMLLKLWMLVSRADWWLTLYAVALGFAALCLLRRAGEKLFSPGAGLLSAAMFAAAPYGIVMAVDVRYYALIALLTLWSYYEFAMLEQEPGAARHAKWAAASILSLYTFHYAIFLFLFQNAYMLIRRRFGVRWIAANAAVVMCYIPWYFVLRTQVNSRFQLEFSGWDWIAGQIFAKHSFMNIVDVAASLTGGQMILAHADDPVSKFVFLGTLFVLGGAAAGHMAGVKRGASPAQSIKIIAALAGSFLLLYCAYLAVKLPLVERYCVGFMPLFFLFAGAGICAISNKGARILLTALFFAVAVFSGKAVYSKILTGRTIPEAVSFIKQNNPDRAPVVVIPKYVSVELWHYDYDGRVYGVPEDLDLSSAKLDFFLTGKEQMDTLDRRLAGHERFWIFAETEGIATVDEHGFFSAWVKDNCTRGRSFRFRNGPFSPQDSEVYECVKKRGAAKAPAAPYH